MTASLRFLTLVFLLIASIGAVLSVRVLDTRVSMTCLAYDPVPPTEMPLHLVPLAVYDGPAFIR